jgi:8-oxo-dGTP pyrophosphatase MutT (NUDIX family)
MKRDGEFRKAVFGVAYTKDNNGKIEYLLLKRKNHWIGWEFPKGKIERFETKRMAVKREVGEETGLKIIKIKRFKEKGYYLYKKKLKDRPDKIGQTYHLFSVQVKKGKVSIDKKEHSWHKWALFKEAYKKLTWPNQKRCLKFVDEWLNRKTNRLL